jgi:segregation and condensation protein A
MAATLVHIKSRMLLPNAPADESDESSDESDIDPRAELVRRLLEYQKYKLAAEQLGSRNLLGRDVFPRGSSEEVASGQPGLEAVSMLKLLDAFQAVLERTQKTKDHEIDFERFSISEKISELMDRLNVEKKLVFHEIFTSDSSRAELIITFLAILEMTRLRLTRLIQDGPFDPIYIELRVSEEDSVAQPDEGSESAGDDHEYE